MDVKFMKFISSVDEDIPVNTRNKFHIFKHASMYYSVYYIKKIAPLPQKTTRIFLSTQEIR